MADQDVLAQLTRIQSDLRKLKSMVDEIDYNVRFILKEIREKLR